MENVAWYWWVVIGLVVVGIAYLKVVVFKAILNRKSKQQTMEMEDQ